MARLHVHAISCNERELMPFFVQHYRDFARAERIVVHYDDATTDGSDQLARDLGAQTVHHARQRDATGELPLDDLYMRTLKNTCWHDSRGQADWVIMCDVDELVTHPNLTGLLDAAPPAVAVLQPEGWDLVGEWPDPAKFVWQSVRRGVKNWYSSKPVLFRADVEINFAIGGHDARPTLGGRDVEILRARALNLLHCSYLGVDFLLRRQAMKRNRPLSKLNVEHNWGAHWKEEDAAVLQKWKDFSERAEPIPDLPPA